MRTIIIYLFVLAPFLAFGQIDSAATAVPLEEVISTEAVLVDSVVVDSVMADSVPMDSVTTVEEAPADSLGSAPAATPEADDTLQGTAVAAGSWNITSDTIKWEYGEIENRRQTEKINMSGYLLTYGDRALLWVQNGYDRPYLLTITSYSGKWEDVERNGAIEYQVSCEGLVGLVKIFRRGNNVWLTIDFSQAGNQPI